MFYKKDISNKLIIFTILLFVMHFILYYNSKSLEGIYIIDILAFVSKGILIFLFAFLLARIMSKKAMS